jgi:hypothetical protein
VHLRPVAQMHSRTHARTVAQTGPQRKALHSSGTKVRCNVTALSTLSTLSAARDRLPAFQHFRARAAAHEPAPHARTETISRRLLQSCRCRGRLTLACAIARTHARAHLCKRGPLLLLAVADGPLDRLELQQRLHAHA